MSAFMRLLHQFWLLLLENFLLHVYLQLICLLTDLKLIKITQNFTTSQKNNAGKE